MKPRKQHVLLAAGLAALALPSAAKDHGRKVQQAHVETMPADAEPQEIEGAKAQLATSPAGAAMLFETKGLTPGHVTTAWWVIINAADECSATPCTSEDVLQRTDTIGAEIVYADGTVVDGDGSAEFQSFLPQGKVDGGWYGHDFEDPAKAEIHLVLNDHGPLVPDLAASMLTSYRGGCTDDSLPPPFPDTAKADGVAGPNACRLVQDAIFVQ